MKMALAISALAVSLVLNGVLMYQKATAPETGTKVIGVIDGDTIVVGNKDRVRLRQMDAPELNLCGGKQAKAALEKLVAGKSVTLSEMIPDQKGRGMALVYAGTNLINEEMLAQGWATYHHDISTKEQELKDAAASAKEKNLGLYGLCWSTENKTDPGCAIKGNIDDIGVKTYFLPDCAQYKFTVIEKNRGEEYFCTEAAAKKAGYAKAKTCGGL